MFVSKAIMSCAFGSANRRHSPRALHRSSRARRNRPTKSKPRSSRRTPRRVTAGWRRTPAGVRSINSSNPSLRCKAERIRGGRITSPDSPITTFNGHGDPVLVRCSTVETALAINQPSNCADPVYYGGTADAGSATATWKKRLKRRRASSTHVSTTPSRDGRRTDGRRGCSD